MQPYKSPCTPTSNSCALFCGPGRLSKELVELFFQLLCLYYKFCVLGIHLAGPRSKMDKVCAVFGGSRGIGKAVAQLMAQKGYRLAIVARNLEVAKATASELGGRYRKGPRCEAKFKCLNSSPWAPGYCPCIPVCAPDLSCPMTKPSLRLSPTPGRL